MMALALRAARSGLGTTAPNPSVGAVIADESTGEVIATGTTAPGGRPHAEPLAIAQAGERARGKTMYVTLEPCSHFGRTPPCVNAILEAGLSRVVLAQEDPDPRVSGRGLGILRAAGVAVRRSILSAEARWLTRGHIVRVTERRPFIQMKLAVDSDGLVPRGKAGTPLFVTSDIARAHGHMIRAQTDAILVGGGTVLDDDPALTCRLPGLAHQSPIRVVLAGERLPPVNSKLVASASVAPVWIMVTPLTLTGANSAAAQLRQAGCRLFEITEVSARPWLPAVCEALVAEGVTRLLVEGGPTLWRAFAQAGLVDEVLLFRAGMANAGNNGGHKKPGFLCQFLPGLTLRLVDRRTVGPDELLTLQHDRST